MAGEAEAGVEELFQHYMYGTQPDAPAVIASQVLHEDKQAFGGLATLREIELRFDVAGYKEPAPIRLLLTTPNGARGPVPCFVASTSRATRRL